MTNQEIDLAAAIDEMQDWKRDALHWKQVAQEEKEKQKQIALDWYIEKSKAEKWQQIATKLYQVLQENVPVGRFPEYPEYVERKNKIMKEYEQEIQ